MSAGASDYIYTCPAAPAGWTAFPGNPFLFGPTDLQGDHTQTIEPGSDQEDVNCHYRNGGGRDIMITGVVDLPIDPNPINDFYFGCNNKDVAWNTTDREYLVMSRNSWSYVQFNDLYKVLTPTDVPRFQALAAQLLHNIAPSAHTCGLNTTTPSEVQASWGFDFEMSISTGSNGKFNAFGGVGTIGGGGIPPTAPLSAGSFVTTGGPNQKGDYHVKSIRIPDVALTVIQNGVTHGMTLHFTKATEFYYNSPHARLVLGVKVIGSKVPGCGKGSLGKLTATTEATNYEVGTPTLALKLCGNFFQPAGIRPSTPTVHIEQT
jgi:hypothetical protein